MDSKSSPTNENQTPANPSPLSSSLSDSDPHQSMTASPFLSPPRASNSNNNNNNNRELSSSTGFSREATPSDTQLDSSNTPLLNGEDIVLLSFSNETTPVTAHRDKSQVPEHEFIGNVQLRGERQQQQQQQTRTAESPPPDSVHSGQLTSLSPPPLSLKSAGSAPPTGTSGPRAGLFTSNGSQGMFSQGRATLSVGEVPQHSHPQPTAMSAGGKKKRPPLPPRWAISQPQQIGGVAVDVFPSHLPPPKQIGSVSHRRVVSTGDVSYLSNLTDVDSVLEESPPSLEAGGTVAEGAAVSGAEAPAPAGGNSQPLVIGVDNGTRQRGVSWDFGAGGREMEGENEERSAFEALGIMQPVLSEEEGDKIEVAKGGVDLMQPILLDEELQTKTPESPLEDMVGTDTKLTTGKSSWEKLRSHRNEVTQLSGSAHSKKHSTQLSQKSFSKKDGSQFEDEAEKAILAALGIHTLNVTVGSAEIDEAHEEVEHSSKESPRPTNSDNEISAEEVVLGVPSLVSSNEPSHRKNVSSITNLEPIGDSPKPTPNVHNLNQRGDMLFEDQGWHDGYDEMGRGPLREKQDTKLTEEALGSKLEIPIPGFEPVELDSQRPPLHPSKSVSRVTGLLKPLHLRRGKTDTEKLEKDVVSSKRDDDNHSANQGEANQKPKHTRNKTGYVDMAEELAKMASLDYNQHTGLHRRTKTGTTNQGINNLLDGADLLYKGTRDDDSEESHQGPSDTNEGAIDGANLDDIEGNQDRDEELGEAKPMRKRATFASATRRSPHRTNSRSERLYHLHRWYTDLIEPKLPSFIQAVKHGVGFVYAPMLILAFILYYACGNPMAQKFDDVGITVDAASWSWWVLFLVRQFFVLGCVKTGEVITIDIFALRTPIFVKVFGTFATLMLVQARGWPYVLTFWGLMDFCFLFGRHEFAAHWLFWQNRLEIFTSANPSGSFVYEVFYMRILITMIVVGVLTAAKRLWLATFLGKRSYLYFGKELEVILAKMLLISQVAHLSRQIEAQVVSNTIADGYAFTIASASKAFPGLTTDSEDDSPVRGERKRLQSADYSLGAGSTGEPIPDGFGKTLKDAGLSQRFGAKSLNDQKKLQSSKQLEIMSLLEEWEEPNLQFESASKTKIKDILQFRQAISLMDDDYCFTPAFGPTSTRAICVDSSEALFNRLVENDPNANLLPFETIAQLAYDSKGELMRPKVKALIKLFRPDRQGWMTKIDFLNSIDSVYKDLRLFRASLENSSQVDDSLESIINVLFYVILFLIVLLILGFQVWESLLSFTTFFFGFSFMFGPASSKYFEGILLILVRRPYDVGEFVNVTIMYRAL
eukprot:CCRYP_009462-RA/>CCRYP_009462-RA protein AED:0.07 eAED:0.07 QI:588/1/1/1/1/0.91/12/1091/1323